MSKPLVDRFYSSFAKHDGDAMAACYHPDVTFEDPAFGELKGHNAGDMWRMLCSGGTDVRIEHTVHEADDDGARVSWVANYTFSSTGRPVRNEITTTMKFRDGKIIDHRDRFKMWGWASQALGVPGRLLGWSPMLKAKVRKMALSNLAAFQAADS
ncbi:MAG: nuclear transport factor 2 family protein [Actinobacteria bacterium]|nr:nuclear transport factor 2 family protein [Actinomycetota bacterium]